MTDSNLLKREISLLEPIAENADGSSDDGFKIKKIKKKPKTETTDHEQAMRKKKKQAKELYNYISIEELDIIKVTKFFPLVKRSGHPRVPWCHGAKGIRHK